MLDSHSITAAGNWQQVWKSKSTQISHPPVHQSKRKNAYVADRTSGRGEGGLYSLRHLPCIIKVGAKTSSKIPCSPLYTLFLYGRDTRHSHWSINWDFSRKPGFTSSISFLNIASEVIFRNVVRFFNIRIAYSGTFYSQQPTNMRWTNKKKENIGMR